MFKTNKNIAFLSISIIVSGCDSEKGIKELNLQVDNKEFKTGFCFYFRFLFVVYLLQLSTYAE